MDTRKHRGLKCDGDYEAINNNCPKSPSPLQMSGKSSLSSTQNKIQSVKIPVKPLESNYVTQIISIGVRPDNIYEAQMLLAPEVDMSSTKITVKGNNLRVTVRKPLSEELAQGLPEITERSALGDLVKKTVKHCENLLIPATIDGDKVRAVVDNKHRTLILTAPGMKPIRRLLSIAMDRLPHHCQENATILKQNDYMNYERMSSGVKTSFKFTKVPNFYIVDDKEYFAAEIKVEGLKVGTAALASENILNIKLHESQGLARVSNLNFLIPPQVNAKKVSVEVFDGTIFIRAPLKKKHV